jgi:hypothetical protein
VFRLGGKRDSTAFEDKENKSAERDLAGRFVDGGTVSDLPSRLNM